ncbi:hypothetical protein [Maricaulis sp. MIT060901]|uniref:hypothetical protein n=1 Tax=Maricaulis sp. MIT060901 TaxID=3096993 RepID=UPI00399BC5B3
MRTPLIILLTAALLGGCFYADEALISRRGADFAVAEGVYTHTPYHPDGRPFDRPTWTGKIERRGWIYSSDTAEFPHSDVRLRELVPGVYAAQKKSDDHYLFGLVWVYPDGLVSYHNPSCSDLSDAAREAYELVEEMEDGACRIERWDVLSAVLQTYLAEHDGAPRLDGVYRPVE